MGSFCHQSRYFRSWKLSWEDVAVTLCRCRNRNVQGLAEKCSQNGVPFFYETFHISLFWWETFRLHLKEPQTYGIYIIFAGTGVHSSDPFFGMFPTCKIFVKLFYFVVSLHGFGRRVKSSPAYVHVGWLQKDNKTIYLMSDLNSFIDFSEYIHAYAAVSNKLYRLLKVRILRIFATTFHLGGFQHGPMSAFLSGVSVITSKLSYFIRIRHCSLFHSVRVEKFQPWSVMSQGSKWKKKTRSG